MESVHYNALFAEIIQSYSLVKHSVLGNLYLKHFSYLEAGDLQTKYFEYLNEAKSRGVLTYKQQEEYIIKEGYWTDADETDILLNEQYLTDIKLTYSKEYLHSRRIQMKKTIEDAELKLMSLKLRKESYMNQTAESYANQKSFSYKIQKSFFKDSNCLTKIDDDLDDSSYTELVSLFHSNQNKFDSDNIKKLSISNFFTNLFALCEDKAYEFYGKPVIALTNHQVDLFMWGRYFKSVLSEHGNSIPQNIQNDPDKLINLIDLRRNAKDARLLDDEKGGNMTIVGAKKEDYELLGLQVTTNTNMNKKLKEKGFLSKDDLFAMEN